MTMQPADIRRLRTLAEENEVLREQVRQLREALTPTIPLPRAWRLKPMEERILRALRRAGQSTLSREVLMQALYSGRDDAPDPRIIDCHICKLRRKLTVYAPRIVVETIIGEGYRLTSDGLAAFDAAVAADRAAYAAAVSALEAA